MRQSRRWGLEAFQGDRMQSEAETGQWLLSDLRKHCAAIWTNLHQRALKLIKSLRVDDAWKPLKIEAGVLTLSMLDFRYRPCWGIQAILGLISFTSVSGFKDRSSQLPMFSTWCLILLPPRCLSISWGEHRMKDYRITSSQTLEPSFILGELLSPIAI